jgi:Tol biopolymer transport system component
MAPEQVRGLALDHRADIFAFGALLYEMLSGERAFKGETAADSMTAILTRDPPDLDATRLSLPPGLERIVRRCLEKSPDLRFQSATDLAFALESFAAPSSSTSSANVVEAPRVPAARAARSVSWLPWALAVLALSAAAVIWFARGTAPAPELHWDFFTRITEAAGEETAPAISPDGGTVAYAIHVGNSWDIYAQRVGGRNAAPILSDPDRDEGAPAFSPDGSRIAFHVSTGLGGIFVAGATGESVRRVTDTGFDPAWSPDGKQIAFASEGVVLPSTRNARSTVFVVDAGGATPRQLTQGDAVQPSWSPSGRRIVYWSNTGADGSIEGIGQRDIYTVAASGGARVPVTRDAAIDWSPVWSPDGRFVYFASDRGGVMNLWRIAVDEESGRVLGAAEPVTTGVSGAVSLPRFSKDGSRLVFRSRVAAVNPVAIPFDPATLHAGAPVLLDTRSTIRVPSDVSPDGKLVAFCSIGETQEDLFVGPPEGPLRRVTDDAIRDRAPMFSRDGKSLLFYSTRDGDWAIWVIGIDGGGLRKVAAVPGGATYPIFSPNGDTIAFGGQGRNAFTAAFSSASGGAPTELPGAMLGNDAFQPNDWSRDGTRLAGRLLSASGRAVGVAVYGLAAHTLTKLTDDEAFAVLWLADGRRVLYFDQAGRELAVLDTQTRTRTVVEVHLPAPAAQENFAISPDNRTIYYGAERTEADIWLVERK